MASIKDLQQDILLIPENNEAALIHYILYRISTMNLPGTVIEGNGGRYYQLTDDANNRVIMFIGMCVQVWNETHQSQELELNAILAKVIEYRNADHETRIRERIIPK